MDIEAQVHNVVTLYMLGRTDFCLDEFDWIVNHLECNFIFFLLLFLYC